MNLHCCGCNARVEAREIKGSELYPHRTDLAGKNFWQCPTCSNYVGCHPKTHKPLGSIPTPELRILRSRVHRVLDPLWKSGRFNRKVLYGEISKRIGWTFHTAQIRSPEEAAEVLRVVDSLARADTSPA